MQAQVSHGSVPLRTNPVSLFYPNCCSRCMLFWLGQQLLPILNCHLENCKLWALNHCSSFGTVLPQNFWDGVQGVKPNHNEGMAVYFQIRLMCDWKVIMLGEWVIHVHVLPFLFDGYRFGRCWGYNYNWFTDGSFWPVAMDRLEV